jgi:multicomponent Na+:H+ antiporter subunit B
MKKSIIFQIGMKTILPVLLMGSFLIFWRGHHLPGGGFIGGLLAGAVLATHSFCFGVQKTLRTIRIHPLSFIFIGLFFALLSGVLSFIVGDLPFTGLWTSIPLIGSLGTPILFDLGVYLLVIGFVVVFITQVLQEDS